MRLYKKLQSCRHEILQIATRHGASNLWVFGSVARGEEDEGSDVDFLVDMEQGRSLFDLAGLEIDLTELLGRKADVVTIGGISPYLKDRILAEAKPL